MNCQNKAIRNNTQPAWQVCPETDIQHIPAVRNVGMMGGTFNPVHNGHLLLAEMAREALGLDRIIFMPSGNSYMKDASAILDGQIRAHMTRLAIEGNPCFSFSARELEREGPTYTCDTLAGLRAENPDIRYYLILGADNLFILEKWRNPEFIFQNCAIAAAMRVEGGGKKEAPNTVEGMAAHLRQKYQADIRLLPGRRIDLSSTEIRTRLREGRSVRYMLPENVLEFINKNGLYR